MEKTFRTTSSLRRTLVVPLSMADRGKTETIGLGTAIKRITSALGIKPCAGCIRRANWLDDRVSLRFTQRRGRH